MSAELAIAAGHFRETFERLQLGIDQLGQCPEAHDLMVSAEFQRDRVQVLHGLTLGALSRSSTPAEGDGKHARSG